MMKRRTIEDVPIGESFEALFEILEECNRAVEGQSPVSGMVVGATRMHVERCRQWLAERLEEPAAEMPGDWEAYFEQVGLEMERARTARDAKNVALRMASYLLNTEIDEAVARRGRDLINDALRRW